MRLCHAENIPPARIGDPMTDMDDGTTPPGDGEPGQGDQPPRRTGRLRQMRVVAIRPRGTPKEAPPPLAPMATGS